VRDTLARRADMKDLKDFISWMGSREQSILCRAVGARSPTGKSEL